MKCLFLLTFFILSVFLTVYMFEINVYIEFSFLVDEVSKNTEVNFMNFITICGVKLSNRRDGGQDNVENLFNKEK